MNSKLNYCQNFECPNHSMLYPYASRKTLAKSIKVRERKRVSEQKREREEREEREEMRERRGVYYCTILADGISGAYIITVIIKLSFVMIPQVVMTYAIGS